jgi:hypothetical protein
MAIFGWAVKSGYMTSGQTAYVVEAVLAFLLWASSAFVGSVRQHLKAVILHKTDPSARITFAEIRAAANAAFFDMITNYFKKAKDNSDETIK